MVRSRPAFSWVEFVLAAAVVVVLVLLLVPAVTKVRVAAARVRCANNVKLLATGVLAYHATHGHFPPGGAAAPDPALTDPAARRGQWTWAYALLPHLGREPLYADPDPAAVRRTPVAEYLCPFRRTVADRYDGAKLDYAANGGPGGAFGPTGPPPLRLGELRNGATWLVILGEKRLNAAALGRAPDDDDAYPTAGWGDDFETYRTAAVAPARDATDPADAAARPGFGSGHPHIFHAAFADGVVRPLRFAIDPDVWRKACLRDGGAVTLPQNHDE